MKKLAIASLLTSFFLSVHASQAPSVIQSNVSTTSHTIHASTLNNQSAKPEIFDDEPTDEPRMVAVDNLALGKVKDFTELGLIQRVDGYSIDKSNRLIAVWSKQQIRWVAPQPMSASDVRSLVSHLEKYKQSIHINTGGHGNKSGEMVHDNPKHAEVKFIKEDVGTIWNKPNVSFHSMSSYSGPIYPKKANHVIDAWCYSKKTMEKQGTIEEEQKCNKEVAKIIEENNAYWKSIKSDLFDKGRTMSRDEELEHLYVPLYGKENHYDDDKYGFDLKDHVSKFLKNDLLQTLVVVGGGGSGKSTFVQFLAKHMCEELNKAEQYKHNLLLYIPVYIPLIAVKNPNQSDSLFEGYLKRALKIEEKRFRKLQEKRKLFFILDAYDEMPDGYIQKGIVRNNISLYHNQSKILITTRHLTLPKQTKLQFLFHENDQKVNIVYASGFTREKKEQYLKKFIEYVKKNNIQTCTWTPEQYLDKFDELNKKNSAKDLFTSPILIRLTAEVLPSIAKEAPKPEKNNKNDTNEQDKYTINKLYEKFIQSYFERGINKYKESNIPFLIEAMPKYASPLKRAKVEAMLCKKMFWDYAKVIGSYVKEQKKKGKSAYFSMYTIEKINNDGNEEKQEEKDEYDVDDEQEEAESCDWDILFPDSKSRTPARKELAFSVMPIKKVRGKEYDYCLWHANMADYLSNKQAEDEINKKSSDLK